MTSATAIPILLYHSVTEQHRPDFLAPFVVTPSNFAEHLEAIAAQGYAPLHITDLFDRVLDGQPLPPRPAAITFDDGYRDYLTDAEPLLRAAQIRATLYMTTDWLSGSSTQDPSEPISTLTPGDLVRLDQSITELGAHSCSHPRLDELDLGNATREITDSKRELEAAAGSPVHSFAYPHGYHTARLKRIVASAGYRNAVAVRNGVSSVVDDVFAISRITVLATHRAADVVRLMETQPLRVGERAITKGWRTYRRTRNATRRIGRRVAT